MKYKTLLILVVIVIIMWLACFYLLTHETLFGWINPLCIATPQDRGLFGDMFGAVNALFSGLAFAGLLYTLHIQHEEIKRQDESNRLERFESKFWNLYNLHLHTVDQLEVTEHIDPSEVRFGRRKEEIYKGKQVFYYFAKDLAKRLKGIEVGDTETAYKRYSAHYAVYYKIWSGPLNRYANTLLSVLDYLITSERIEKPIKQQCFDIVSAHMTINERVVIFYYVLLAPEYKLLKRLRLAIYNLLWFRSDFDHLIEANHIVLFKQMTTKITDSGIYLTSEHLRKAYIEESLSNPF